MLAQALEQRTGRLELHLHLEPAGLACRLVCRLHEAHGGAELQCTIAEAAGHVGQALERDVAPVAKDERHAVQLAEQAGLEVHDLLLHKDGH